MFTTIPGRVCGIAEFFKTWLGKSWQTEAFGQLIARGNDVKVIHREGETLYEIYKAPRPESDGDYQARTDVFHMDRRTGLMTYWRVENVYIRAGVVAGYLVLDRHYFYRIPGQDPDA